MSRGNRFLCGVALVLAVVLGMGVAHASVVKMSVPDLIGDSDLVIQGKVRGTVSYWQDGIIVTAVTVKVQTEVIGNPRGGLVTVLVPGGIVGDLGLEVSDTPEFRRNGESVLFLKDAGNGDFLVSGNFQGQISVVGGQVPAWDMPAEEFLGRIAAGGIGLEESPAKPDNPGGGKGGGGKEDPGYKLCKLDWKANGDFNDPVYSPAGGWKLNDISGIAGEVAGALQAAADEWDNKAGANWALGLGVEIAPDSGRDGAAFDGDNLVTFGDTGGSVATNYNWFYRFARRNIIETDMVFNIVDWDFGVGVCGSETEFDFQEVATHEFGHWLCLGDQYEAADVDKTMYGYVDFGECHKKDLWDTDKAGAQAIYGASN